MDIETAFLYGILEEEIFMKIPEGLDTYTKDVILMKINV